jgi:hypothetical protein
MIAPEPSPSHREASSAWLLARAARVALADPASDPGRVPVLENAYRLMQSHGREETFPGLEAPTRRILDASLASAYPDLDRAGAHDAVVEALRAAAHPPAGTAPLADPVAAGFFGTVAEACRIEAYGPAA